VGFDDVEIVKVLVQNMNDLDTPNKDGMTALHNTMYYEKPEMVKLLIDKSDITKPNSNGETALHLGIERDLGLAKLLVDSAAPEDFEREDSYGYTPLTWAAGSMALIELLKDKVDLAKPSPHGKIILHWATIQGNSEVLKMFSDKADVAAKDDDGMTALHFANVKLAEFLIHKDPKLVEIVDEDGQTVLYHTAKSNTSDKGLEKPRMLVEYHPNLIPMKDKRGQTVLFCVAQLNRLELTEMLIEKSADLILMVDKEEQTALHCAVSRGSLDMIRLLVKHNADVLKMMDKRVLK
jgi:ankyrin repeat protein